MQRSGNPDMKKYLGSISSVLVLLATLNVALAAQIETIPTVDPNKRRPTPAAPGRRGPATRIIERTRTEKVFTLTVTTEPKAMVVLTPVTPKTARPLKKEANDDGTVVFERPTAGTYKIEVSKADYETKKEDIKVLAQKSDARRMDLKPITYKLNIKTTLTGGSIRYARREDGSTVAMGSPGAVPSNYCVLAIRPNGEVMINDLRRGQYDINVLPDSPEFDVKGISITVPQDTLANEADNPGAIKTLPVQLDNRKSTDIFSANAWSDADWVKPASWKIEKGMKVRNTEGIALPANDRYRHYIDFELIANVRLNNDGAAGFALRARNERNGYLLLISGPKSADGPNAARLYVLKDGEKKDLNTLSLSAFSSVVSSDKGFQMRVQGDKLGFILLIEDSDGTLQKAGRLPDDLNTYPIGAVGIAAIDKPDFDVRQFQVCTPRCQ